jgi:outer membrane murein-binding lipoprotein Lpp
MFFKRLSRSRSNSQSYVDNYHSPHDSKANSANYDDAAKFANEKYAIAGDVDVRPGSSRQSNQAPQLADPLGKDTSTAMYPRQSQPTEVANGQYVTPPVSAGGPRGGHMNGYSSFDSGAPPASHKTQEPPNLLLEAFNQALRPYTEKVDVLESEIQDLRAYIDSLEKQREEVFAWIDKRGLRPDVPPNIAHQMDAAHGNSATQAAQTLNAQLDRKITIVNFDLHRLQDDLNDSLPTPSFSACMLKFLPDIARLAALPSGPHHAFDLLLKLGGNLNSHGGLESGDEEDLQERRAFYARLDDAMVDIVQGRFREEGDSWGVQREIKRIEKTGAYLKNWGVEPYFPRTLDVMRQGGQAMDGAPVSPPTYN